MATGIQIARTDANDAILACGPKLHFCVRIGTRPNTRHAGQRLTPTVVRRVEHAYEASPGDVAIAEYQHFGW